MKRLISWLLALTMIMSLPLSAFAVGIDDGNSSWDEDVDFGDLVGPTYIDLDTVVTMGPGSTFEVTVPAGEAVYYKGGARYAGLAAIIDGETEILLTRADDGFVYLTIANETEEAKTYTVVVNYPLGSVDNPVVIEEMSYNGEVSQAAGDSDGYCYTYTATNTGVVTLYFDAVYDENGDLVENVGIRDISVTNMNTYAQYSLQQDGVDFYGLQLQVPVTAGQELMIVTAWVKDAEGNMFPAANYTWTADFSYPAGTQNNPIVIDWAWDENMANGTATVEVAADGTYYMGEPGMILTVNGVETALENGMFVLNAGTYELALTTPVGQNVNPEVIDDINGNFSGNLAEGAEGYYYIWTATEDGTVTLDASEGANLIVTHFGDVVSYDDGESQFEYQEENHYQLATAIENEETWALEGWDVAENIQFEVKAGHSVKIQVVALEVGNWEKPAIEYTLTGSFKTAEPTLDTRLTFSSTALSLKSGIIGQFIMTDPIATYGYDSVKIVVEKAGETTEVTTYQVNGSRIAFEVGFTAKMMTEKATITIYAEKDGVTYVGEPLVDWTIKDKGIEMLDKYYKDYDKNRKTICDLVANMLYYGTTAQKHFKYNEDNYATDGLKQEYLDLIITGETDIKSITYPENPADAVFKRNNTALSLGANIQLQMRYALPAGDLSAYHAVIENKDRGTKYDDIAGSDFAVSGKNVYVLFDGVTAQQLRETLVITIYEGETPVSASFELSIENVAAGMLSKYPELIPAMINYSDCAKAHFGS